MKIGFASADRMTVRKIAICLLMLAPASGASAAEVTIPAKLQPGPNEALVVTYAAKGVQVYECRAKKDANGYEWAFVAPEAELYDSRGQPVGRHGEGPFWRASDGSKIVGTVKERVDAPTAGAIPWLLLSTKSDGPAGTFSKVTSVQRVNTTGGIAPTDACTADSVGKRAGIPYSADYRFFAVK